MSANNSGADRLRQKGDASVTELSERKKKILKTIIDDYISTAMPVGSKTIAQHMGMSISSATVRNEMNELETMGYLDQPHTSAGRIPSDKAFRMYVDSLMEMSQLTSPEMDFACDYYDERMVQTETVLKAAASAISEATDYVSVVMVPRLSSVTIRHLQLVPITPSTALAVLVTDAGVIRDTPVSFNTEVTPQQLEDVSKSLNGIFSGRRITPEDLDIHSEIMQELRGQREIFSQVTDIIRDHLLTGDSSVEVGGAARLLSHPEYNDVGKAREMLQLLDSGEIGRAIEQSDGVELKVTIGSENRSEHLKDCSVVTASYKIGGRAAGTIGVIGPVRMKYDKVIKVLSYMKASLSEVLSSSGKLLDQNGKENNDEQEQK